MLLDLLLLRHYAVVGADWSRQHHECDQQQRSPSQQNYPPTRCVGHTRRRGRVADRDKVSEPPPATSSPSEGRQLREESGRGRPSSPPNTWTSSPEKWSSRLSRSWVA